MGFRNLPEMKPNNKPQFAGVGFDFGGGETDHPVTSVNGETGAVVLDAADVGALPSDTSIPTKTSDLENDSGFVDSDIIAPVEATSTASRAYTTGQYFINSLGQLCRVTVDIASGGTITVGTNCVIEPVGAALTSLNSNISKHHIDVQNTVNLASLDRFHQYITPCDGYAAIVSNTNSSGYGAVGVSGDPNTGRIDMAVGCMAAGEYSANMIFVKAGMGVFGAIVPSGWGCYFYPLE